MRVVGGEFRGRRLVVPSGKDTRPTSDQARESIFNILKHASWAPDLNGAIVIDVFAGCGALGLEACSRGAAFCLFVETAPKARAAIRTNIEEMKLGEMTRLHQRDATKLRIASSNLRGPFTHIFLDPPYHKGLASPVLRKLQAQNLIAKNALIIFEMSKDEEPNLNKYALYDTRIWGAAKVVFMGLKT